MFGERLVAGFEECGGAERDDAHDVERCGGFVDIRRTLNVDGLMLAGVL